MALGYTFLGRCKGMTKAGGQCRHIVVFANGYCRQHGGDSTEYMKAALVRQREKALRRAARFERKLKGLGIVTK